VSKFRVFADGVVFEGPEAMSVGDTHDLSKGYECLLGRPVTRVTVGDKRAQQVLVTWTDGRFWAVPSRQSFSRHLGVCLILGDKTSRGRKHTLKVGDILRLGSVGLLVSEMKTDASDGGKSQVVSQEVLDQIREDVHTAPRQVLAPLRKEFFVDGSDVSEDEGEEDGEDDEDEEGRRGEDEGEEGGEGLEGVGDESGTEHSVSSSGSGGEGEGGLLGGGGREGGGGGDGRDSRYQCYICMDSEEEDGDMLIAPCQCKGSTALVHVKCLQRLLSTGDAARRACVTSTKHQSHTCKICKARYKTHVRLPDGTLIPLLNPSLAPPHLTLVVITRHESHPDLFNTIFQLSFARMAELSLGRSQGCDVVIGYRTVSTRHATISYSKGEFHYQDARSSNGSLLYLRGPLEIPSSRPLRLRMGRSVLSLRARNSLQLTTMPRRAVADAWRWLAGRKEGREGGREEGVEGGEEEEDEDGSSGGRAGMELLRDLHLGRFQPLGVEGGTIRAYEGEGRREGGPEKRAERGLMWHVDSSPSEVEGGREGRSRGFGSSVSCSSSTSASGSGSRAGISMGRRGGGVAAAAAAAAAVADSGGGGGGNGFAQVLRPGPPPSQQEQQEQQEGQRQQQQLQPSPSSQQQKSLPPPPQDQGPAGGIAGGGGTTPTTTRCVDGALERASRGEGIIRGGRAEGRGGMEGGEDGMSLRSQSAEGEDGLRRDENPEGSFADALEAVVGEEEGVTYDLDMSSSLPLFRPSLAHSDLASAPSRRVVLERTRSSRV